MAIRPDWNIGKITLIAGSAGFSTTSAMLSMAAIEPGDVIFTPSGHTLVIKEITGNNSGTLMLPCPADAAGADLPLRIRFQPDGSRVAGALRAASALLTGNNVEAFAGLIGQPDMVPVFMGAGTMGLLPVNVMTGGGGSWSALSPDIAGLSAYATEPVEFKVLVINNGGGKSAIYQKTGAGNAWSSPIPFTGPTGAANTLTIGTVAEGVVPAAYITGSAPNQVLNLELVRGIDGDPGPIGDVTPAVLAAKEAAERAENKSEEWASNPVDAEVEAGKFSSLHYAVKTKLENEGAADSAAIVRDNKPNIDAIAANIANINAVSAIDSEVADVAAIKDDITAARANAANINAVSANEQSIDVVAANAAHYAVDHR